MGNSGQSLPTKDEVVATIIDIFIDSIGFIERHEVSSQTHIVKDFRIYTDDLTIFLMMVEKHFGIHPLRKEWSSFEPTITNIAEFVLRHLESDKR